ncbi:MAG: hypothetical protein GQ548_07520 [Methylophaga sp.]|nr:hypothetical protein [Methylophaga sp.]
MPYLTGLIEHQNSRVRYEVVFGLSGFDDNIAVEALIKLSRDESFDVRNWATFELGSLCDVDTKELRAALYERISDSEYELRGEALVGLAMRKGSNIQENLLKELEGEFNGIWAVEAAKILASQQYCEVLKELRDRLIIEKEEERFLNDVSDAIASCCQNKT